MTERRTARAPAWFMFAVLAAFGAGATIMFVTGKQEAHPAANAEVSSIGMKAVRIPIQGMVCTVCAASVKKTLLSLEGVQGAEISLERREAQVQYIEGKVSAQQLVAAIDQLGYKAGEPVPEASQ